jgi:hypothetical protein
MSAQAEYELASAPADSEAFLDEHGVEFLDDLNARGTPHGPFETVFELDDVADCVEEHQRRFEVWRTERRARERAAALTVTIPRPSRAPRRGHVGPRQRPSTRRRTCSTRAGPGDSDPDEPEPPSRWRGREAHHHLVVELSGVLG